MRPMPRLTPEQRAEIERELADPQTQAEINQFMGELLTGAVEEKPGLYRLDNANLKRLGLL